MEKMNEIRRKSFAAVLDREIQGSSTMQVVEEKSAYKSKNKICSVKPKSVQSREMQLTSEKPVKSERKRRRTKVNDVYIDIESKFSVIERADRVLCSLENEFPYFQKCMLPSNVCHSFWLIFPVGFCKSFLPNCDSTVTLVDESGVECKTTYLFKRRGLSAGWRRFSISHKLLKGDLLVFQLIDHCKFKVHIVRVYEVDVVDAAHCLMNMVASSGTTSSDLVKKQERRVKRKKKYADCRADGEVDHDH